MEASNISPFRLFSEQIISDKALACAVLHLRHRSSLHVNMLLYLLWLARAQYGRLTKKQLRQLLDFMMSWHQRIVAELKYTYRMMADEISEPALQIKNELETAINEAVIIEQDMLYESQIKNKRLKRSIKQQLLDACLSIKIYCEVSGDTLSAADRAPLELLCQHIFMDLEKQLVQAQVDNIFTCLQGASAQLSWREF